MQRVKAGLEAAKQRGTKLGALKAKRRKYRINTREKKVGMSYRAIAKDLGLSFGSVQKVGKATGL